MRRLPEGAPILNGDAMRAAEAAAFAAGLSLSEAMERAGRAVATQVARLAAGRPILVLAGPGNNGGDARIAAQWLVERGHDVALANVEGLGAASARPVLVDGLFGIGLSRPLAPLIAEPFHRLARSAELVVAIDLPSGIDADDGTDFGAVPAHVTIALGALKPGHVLAAGVALCGHVLLADIGIAIASRWQTLARPRLAAPTHDSHKYRRGMVAVIGGAMPGAALLAAQAAMRGGAGYAVLTGDAPGGPHALVRRPADTALFGDRRIGALVVGPGLGALSEPLDRALASDLALVVDGDALSLLGRDVATRLHGCNAVLTPQGGEFDRMFGNGGGSKIDRTLAAAAASGCVVVHKGADTVIAAPDGAVTVSAAASPWLASAGSGDVLAGLVAAQLATGGDVAAAVWLHDRAAAIAGPALIADDLIRALPQAVAECL